MENTFQIGPIQEKWLQSLEQHPERQTTDTLGFKESDGTYKACCLGEAGLIAGVCKWDNGKLKTIPVDSVSGSTAVLRNVYTAIGLYSSIGDTKVELNYVQRALSNLNDSGVTWPEIAAIVRANPTHYFAESV